VVIFDVPLAQSKITAQGQISVPLEVRRRLGVGPGSVLEWDADGEQVVIRRAGRYTSQEIHQAVFPSGPPTPHALAELKDGVRRAVRRRHARR
jgi:AbrB family looped-hinge helix DNA binding protein